MYEAKDKSQSFLGASASVPLVARIEHLVDYEMPPEIKRVEGIRVMVYRPV